MFSIRVSGKVSYFNPDNLKKAQKAANKGAAFFYQDNLIDNLHGFSIIEKHRKEPNKHRKTNKNDFFDRCTQLYTDTKPTGKQFNLITLTLPSIFKGIYQNSNICEATGDKAVTKNLSRFLESLQKKYYREHGFLVSYVWAAERQQERKKRYGGIGDLHFHIFTNLSVKQGFYCKKRKKDITTKFNTQLLSWMQNTWCNLLSVPFTDNCIDIRPISGNMESVCSYIAKYLSKSDLYQVPILSKKWSSSKDLKKMKPVQSTILPDCKLYRIHENEVLDKSTGEVFTMPIYYFDSFEIKEKYFKSQPEGVYLCLNKSDKEKQSLQKRRFPKIFKGVKPEILTAKLEKLTTYEPKEKNYFPKYLTMPVAFYNIYANLISN